MGEESQASATLTNSIIGVTVLAMPYCFAQCGFVLAPLLLALVSLATMKSSEMLLSCALATKRGSYEFLAHYVYGPAGKLVVEISMIGLSLGTLVAFHIIVGDLCPQVVAAIAGWNEQQASPGLRTWAMTAFAGGVILPLSLMRNTSSLSMISYASLVFYGLFLLHLFFQALVSKLTVLEYAYLYNPYEAPYNWFRPRGVLYSLPIMSLAFSCQTQLFLLYDSLSNPNIKTVQRIINFSVVSSCVFYILVGAIGYIAFNASHPTILGDMTAMYPSTAACNVVRLLLVLSVAVSFPVIAYPCRVSMHSLIYLRQTVSQSLLSDQQQLPAAIEATYIPEARFRVITVAIVASTLVGGIWLPSVEFVLGITGALTGSVICYILPAGFFLATFKNSGRAAAVAILMVGLLALCVSSLALLVGRSGHGHLATPPQLQPADNLGPWRPRGQISRGFGAAYEGGKNWRKVATPNWVRFSRLQAFSRGSGSGIGRGRREPAGMDPPSNRPATHQVSWTKSPPLPLRMLMQPTQQQYPLPFNASASSLFVVNGSKV